MNLNQNQRNSRDALAKLISSAKEANPLRLRKPVKSGFAEVVLKLREKIPYLNIAEFEEIGDRAGITTQAEFTEYMENFFPRVSLEDANFLYKNLKNEEITSVTQRNKDGSTYHNFPPEFFEDQDEGNITLDEENEEDDTGEE